MGKLISKCPKCNTVNEVDTSNCYMKGDEGTPVTCTKCSLRFCATLSKKDIKVLFVDEKRPLCPVVKGEEDYLLESTIYP